jgi:hypothetical protein
MAEGTANRLDAVQRVARARVDAARAKLAGGFSTTNPPAAFDEDDAEHSESVLLAMCKGYEEQWRVEVGDLKVVATELALEARTTSPRDVTSRDNRFAGHIDKLCQDKDGQFWIIEHKTSGRTRPLSSWLDSHYNPQAETYAYLLSRAKPPIKPAGVVYDLALKDVPPAPGSLELVKDRTTRRMRLPARLPRHASEPWLRAELIRLGQDLADYRGDLDSLHGDDLTPTLFRREWVRFSGDAWNDVERVGRELHVVASELRLAHDKVSHYRKVLLVNPGDHIQTAKAAISLGAIFPRNASGCYAYGRRCEYMDLCRFPSPEAASAFTCKENLRENP